MYYTYVLKSKKNGNFYTGFSSDLRKRFREHNEGKSAYTRGRGPYDLLYYEACMSKEDAQAREKYLKSGMGKRYISNRNKRFLSLTG